LPRRGSRVGGSAVVHRSICRAAAKRPRARSSSNPGPGLRPAEYFYIADNRRDPSNSRSANYAAGRRRDAGGGFARCPRARVSQPRLRRLGAACRRVGPAPEAPAATSNYATKRKPCPNPWGNSAAVSRGARIAPRRAAVNSAARVDAEKARSHAETTPGNGVVPGVFAEECGLVWFRREAKPYVPVPGDVDVGGASAMLSENRSGVIGPGGDPSPYAPRSRLAGRAAVEHAYARVGNAQRRHHGL